MSNLAEPITISSDPNDHGVLNFDFLRQEGIKHIQQLAGKVWTDHNMHDPGITILEQLCYALTDLSYRINYDLKDLIAEESGDAFNGLFTPAEILTVNPVTILDIRKVVLDVEGVKNAWVETVQKSNPEVYYNPAVGSLELSKELDESEPLQIKGLYRILIEQNEFTGGANIITDVNNRLHNCRSICEDFAEIKVLKEQAVTIAGEIEVGQVEDINLFAAQVLFKVASFISPRINFYSLSQLLAAGKSVDEIFEGPALMHGFIDDEELLQNERKTALFTSDVIKELMDVHGVVAVNKVALLTDAELGKNANANKGNGPTSNTTTQQDWRLQLDIEKTPQLKVISTLQYLRFIKNEMVLTPDVIKVEQLFKQLRDKDQQVILNENERNILPVKGRYRQIDNYFSIQNTFPETYGIGQFGLPESATTKRVAQANQLKGYLLFFEQIIANYFAQVANTKNLFSFSSALDATYFSKPVIDAVPGAAHVVNDVEDYNKHLANCTENITDSFERKNRVLNHLMARFSEGLTDYSLWLYDKMIRVSRKTREGATILDSREKEEELHQLLLETSDKLVKDKVSFLKNYPSISNDRGKAFNYKRKSWDTDNISGLEKRIAGKLGVLNYKRRTLADNDEEGFHMLEHILLRPIPEDYSSLAEYLLTKYITKFEKAGADAVLCTSPSHGLQNGESIIIRGSSGYNNTFIVQEVKIDSFQINTKYTGAGNTENKDGNVIELKPDWVRTQVNTRILLLARHIQSFTASAVRNQKTVQCFSPSHGLVDGDEIEILETQKYNGTYNVLNATRDTFDIAANFNDSVKEVAGSWLRVQQRIDPYSLQLTFVFPDRPEAERINDRFQNNNYRVFIENTIREQTPVHLTVYIRWLGRAELAAFETAFKTFLNELSINLQ